MRARTRLSVPSEPTDTEDRLAPTPTEALDLADVRYTKAEGIARVTIDRPRAYNAYSTATLKEITRAMENASLDDEVGVIVLTGGGTRAFCTGGDVKEYADRFLKRPHDYWKYMAVFRGAVESILHSGKPVIARLNGITVGGGNELHLACDLSVAASHIYLGQVGVGVGSVAAGGATQWLPITVGDRRARSMLLLNERISPAQALDWGLVSATAPSVVKDGTFLPEPTAEEIAWAQKEERGYRIDLKKLDEAVDTLARRLLGMFPECLRYTKAQTNIWKEWAWNQSVSHAQEWLALHFATVEPYEGMNAFVDKRPARVTELRSRLARGDDPDFLHGPPLASCGVCGEAGLPSKFRYCGRCGALLEAERPANGTSNGRARSA